ncbi:MAG: DUF6502 family protein [Gammaproteobacteria bacterium]|nr:DUF6502 family protein [Gammaproteobacteria bacterium]MDH3448578.1 DUF6502 family protein [Gammaproteobacteria bacterium]
MQEILQNALRNILTAIVRTLLRNGMSYGEFDQVARKCFVDVAFGDFAPANKKQTVSNVAILTGLNRKEVKKLHEQDAAGAEADGRQYNRVVRVLGGWINDSRFLRKDGNPRDLDYEGKDSFSELVRQYSGDMPVAAMQKVLTGSGNIELTDGNKLRLLSHAYLPSDDPVEKLTILGVDTSQLIETIDYNLTAAEEDLRFQRKASNPKIASEAIPEIKQFLRRKGQAFLEEVDLYLTQHETDDDSGMKLSVGVFYHESDSESPEVKK